MPLLRVHFLLFLVLLAFWADSSLALEWIQTSGYRFAPLTIPATRNAGFTEVIARAAGIRFTNLLNEERSLTNQIYLNGSGVAAGDIDGDGLCDLYFCGLDSPNALYRNLANWRFADITTEAGVACANQASTGAAFADVDNDGDLDLLVNGIREGTRLFLNDGKGKFREVTDEAGLRNHRGSTSFALADIDGDGLLDLYVTNYRNDTMGDLGDVRFKVGVTNGVYQVLFVNGVAPTTQDLLWSIFHENNSSVLENGEADVLFRNLGHGKFSALSWTNGTFLDEQGATVSIPYNWGLSPAFAI